MVSRNILIGKISPFLGKKEMLVNNQDTVDIIDALINNHYKYSNEYDKIFRYFDGGNVEETAYNVFEFLKGDFKYTIEPEKMQILRSPSAILASNIIGIDCKGYATFANGIMDAYRRNSGKDFEVFYRFASYDPFDKTPQHVFAVVKEGNKEFWIDPVLEQFDERKQPHYYKDKKIKNMALVAMSGVPNIAGMDDRNNYIGADGKPWWQVVVEGAPEIITSLNPSGGFAPSGNVPSPPQGNYNQPDPSSGGIGLNNILLIAAVGIGAYFIFKKK